MSINNMLEILTHPRCSIPYRQSGLNLPAPLPDLDLHSKHAGKRLRTLKAYLPGIKLSVPDSCQPMESRLRILRLADATPVGVFSSYSLQLRLNPGAEDCSRLRQPSAGGGNFLIKVCHNTLFIAGIAEIISVFTNPALNAVLEPKVQRDVACSNAAHVLS